MNRLARLVALLTRLQSRRISTARALAEHFECSIRTIYRDIRTLESAGVPIHTIEGKGYSLVPGYSLPPIMFTEAEANALLTAHVLVSRNKDQSLVDSLEEAIMKIKAVLSEEEKEKSSFLEKRMTSFTNISQNRSSFYLTTIQKAITEYRLLIVRYHSFYTDEVTDRVLEPLALYHTRDNWILISWCRLRIDLREFRLDRILELRVSDDKFDPRDFDMLDYFQSILQNSKGGRAPLT